MTQISVLSSFKPSFRLDYGTLETCRLCWTLFGLRQRAVTRSDAR
jgi:hypothetical protein